MIRRSNIKIREDYFSARVIAALYRLLLNRDVDPSGLASALAALNQNIALSAIVTRILRSDEFTRLRPAGAVTADAIDRWFRSAFGRPPMQLGPGVRALSPEAYAAHLLIEEEQRTPTLVSGIIAPGGIDPGDAQSYHFWILDHYTPDAERRSAIQTAADSLPPGVSVSLIVIDDSRKVNDISATLATIRAQLCDRFELIVVGRPATCIAVARQDPSAITLVSKEPDFPRSFNMLLERCRGAFVWVLDSTMRLELDAVFHIAVRVANDPDNRIVAFCADHDTTDADGRRLSPCFRSGWDPDAALCRGDWSRDVLLRTACVRDAGGVRPDYRGCEWDDLALRVMRTAGDDGVCHIPRPLFSLAPHVYWAQRRGAERALVVRGRSWFQLVNDHLAQMNGTRMPPPELVPTGNDTPARVVYRVPDPPPLVSIIIPTRDKVDLLRSCIDGLLYRTNYPRIEILVIDNRSVELQTHAYLTEISERPNVRVLRFDRDFNWGAMNNLGARAAEGDIVLLLNNDTDVIDPDWLSEMVAQVMRPEVGVVGAKLLYHDRTVQHAGLVLGPDAHAFHRFRHVTDTAPGYRDELAQVRNVSAVTGACLAIRRDVFEAVGGIEETTLAVTWSDVDLCFRVRERGYRVICTPFARMLHLELATRGADDTPERITRAERERQAIMLRWPWLANEDRYFNPNFQLQEGDTRLASSPRLGDRLAPSRQQKPGNGPKLGSTVAAGNTTKDYTFMVTDTPPDPRLIGEVVLAMKSRIAPAGSFREKGLRLITRPLLRLLLRRRSASVVRDVASYPTASVVRWRGLPERAALLGERPRILILKLDHIGDFIVGMPAIAQLRTAFPDAILTLVCASWNRPWAERTGWFESVLDFDFFTQRNADWTGATLEQLDAFASRVPGRYDIAIDLRHDADTRPLLMRVDALYRAGFAAPSRPSDPALDIALPDVEHISPEDGTGLPVHAEMRLLLLADSVISTFTTSARHPAQVLLTGRSRQGDSRPYAILAPGAGSPIRCWPPVNLIEIARRLIDRYDLDIVLTGGPSEVEAAATIAAALPPARLRNLCGTLSLADLPDLIAGGTVYVGCDTGTTHLAAALEVATVAILTGVPNIEVWYPKGRNVNVVAARIACSPCYLVHAEQCPYRVPCMTAITVAHVWEACEDAVAGISRADW